MSPLIGFIPFFLLFDAWELRNAKSVLIQFLTGILNRKNWNAFHRRQKWTDRLTLNYIEPLLKKHKKQFRFLHRLYKIMLYTAAPQSVLLWILSFVFTTNNAARMIFCVLLLPRILFTVVFWLQCDSCHQLKCVQNKRP